MINSNSSELQRGLIADYQFDSLQSIRQQNGTVTGVPSFSPDRGMRFDGSTNYVTFPGNVQPFNGFGWSAVIEFYPDFDITLDGAQGFFSTNGNKTYLTRYKSGVTHFLTIASGNGTALINSAYAVWGPYWKHGQRNQLAVALRSGSNTMWLNGVQIGNTGVVWVPEPLTGFKIGSYDAGTFKFSGSISSIKFFKHSPSDSLLIAQEAKDFYTNSTYTYQNKATCILPMSAATHDATNNRTLDVSGNGNHFQFGNGVTAGTFPVKMATRGYDSTTTSMYLSSAKATGFLPLSDFTIIHLFRPKRYPDVNSYPWSVSRSANDNQAGIRLQHATTIGQRIIGASSVSTTQPWANGSVMFYANAYQYASTKWLCYFNGKYLTETAAQPPATDYLGRFYIGIDVNGAASNLVGEHLYFALYPFILTPLQVRDSYINVMRSLNQV
jgi:hypothetical protein